MKTYSKIIGILLTLAGIGALILLIFAIIETEYIEEKIGLALTFVPCLIFLHYMYIHNFGFNLKSEIPQKKYRLILVLSILSIIISAIVPAGYLFKEINILKNTEEMIDRGTDKTTNGVLKATLKTKFQDGNLKYVFNVEKNDKSELDWGYYDNFSFELKDKDGFKIKTIEIKDYVSSIDGDKRYGIYSNSSEYMDIKDYLRIDKWDLIFRTKK